MKYIVMEVKMPKGGTLEIPFVFPDIIVHAMMAQVAKPLCEATWPGCITKPIAAGNFCSLDLTCECGDWSETLNLYSRGDTDSQLLRMADYGGLHA